MIYNKILDFLKNRTIELVGLIIVSAAIVLSISFFSYSPADPSYVYNAENVQINNLLGIYGGLVADFLLQSFGLISFMILITFLSWGVHLIVKKSISNILTKSLFVVLYIIFGSTLIYSTFNNSFWLIDNGNSGFVGHFIYNFTINYIPILKNQYTPFVLIVLTLIFFLLASEINFRIFLNVIKKVL